MAQELKLTEDEVQALRAILSCLVVKDRTGTLGIMHGAERFVSTGRNFKKAERDQIDSLARKAGLGSGLPLYRG